MRAHTVGARPAFVRSGVGVPRPPGWGGATPYLPVHHQCTDQWTLGDDGNEVGRGGDHTRVEGGDESWSLEPGANV